MRLAESNDYKLVMTHVQQLRKGTAESLVSIEPTDANNISRFQGRVNAYDMILDMTNEAERMADTNKGTDNG